jgi:hypothetical protein
MRDKAPGCGHPFKLLVALSRQTFSVSMSAPGSGGKREIMRVVALTAMVLVLALQGCGGAPTHESLAKDAMSIMKEFGAVLEGIKDEASAKSAEPALKKLAERMKTLSKQKEALPKLSEADEKKVMEKFTKEGEEIMGKLLKESMRVAMIPGANKVVEEAMKDIQAIK